MLQSMTITMTKNIILLTTLLTAAVYAETPIPPEMVWESGSSVYNSWNSGEPNNSGDEDCAAMLSDGSWNDASCGNAYSSACYNGSSWAVFTAQSAQVFARAGRNCFDGYEFSAPVTAAQNSALKAAADAAGASYPLWINLQDREQEGHWIFNQRANDSPYTRGGDLSQPVWYAVVDGNNNQRSGPFTDYETGQNTVTFEQALDINTGAPDYWKVNDGGLFGSPKPEPNNSGDCAQLYVNDGGLWDDTNCSNSKKVACFNGYEWAVSADAVSFDGGTDTESMDNPMNACTRITVNGEAGNFRFAAPLSVQDSLTLQTIGSQAGASSIWINLQDKKYENVWKFNKNLDVVAPFWRDGEPNNAGSGEDCAEMSAADGLWNDLDCAQLRRVACFDPYDGVYGQWQVTATTYAFDQDIEVYNQICETTFGSKYKFYAPERLSQRSALQTAAASGTLWINATDRDSEGSWKINRELNNWADGEPAGNNTLRCVMASLDSTLWTAADCSNSLPVACFSGGRWYFTATAYTLDDFLDGQNACQAMNPGYLFAAPKDVRQMQAIRYFARQQELSGNVWINGNRLEDINQWVWNERNLQIPAWSVAEPDGGSAENCALLNSDGSWADTSCSGSNFHYLCRNNDQWQLSASSGSLGDFSAASLACQALGSGWSFAAPQTYNENLNALAAIPANTQVWLNATDSVAENDWVINAANITQYPAWQAGQPDNGGILAADETDIIRGQDCVAQYSDGSWADVSCTAATEYPWACTDGHTWKVTRGQGKITRFDDGHRQCFYEYGSAFVFSAPLDRDDVIQIDFARLLAAKQRGSAVHAVWLNMTDGGRENEVTALASGAGFAKNLPYSNWLNAYPGMQPDADCAFKTTVAAGQNNPWRTFNCTSEAAHYACFDGASWNIATSKGQLVGGTLQITPQVGEDYWSYDRGNQLCKEQFGDNYYFSAPVTAAEDLALDAAIRKVKAQVKNTWINYYRNNRISADKGNWFANRLELNSWQQTTFNNFNNADCSLLHPDGSLTDADCSLDYAYACFDGSWVLSGSGPWRAGFQVCADNENSMYAVPRTPDELQQLTDLMGSQPLWINLTDTALESQWIANRLRFSWWADSEPSNTGNRDCAKLSAQSGQWYAARCSVEAARFACRTINAAGNITWQITAGQDIWSRGFSQCQLEYPGSEFMAPQGYGATSAANSQAALSGVAALAQADVWINLSDQEVESNWRSYLAYNDWGVTSLLNEDLDCAYYDRQQQGSGTWYAGQCKYTATSAVSRGYSCTDGYEWRLVETAATVDQRWSQGFTACQTLGSEWYFAAPTNAVENAKLKLVMEIAGIDQVWINAQDRIEEGNWSINGAETNFPVVIDTSATPLLVNENQRAVMLSAFLADDEEVGIGSAEWSLLSDSRFADVTGSDIVLHNMALTPGANGTALLTAEYDTPVLLLQDVTLVFRVAVTDIPSGTATAVASEAFVTVTVKAPILAHYTFDDTGRPQQDVSGNGHDALNTLATPMPPVVSGALSVSGSERMVVPGLAADAINGLVIPADEYTVAFRISIEGDNNGTDWRGILQKGDGGMQRQPALFLFPDQEALHATNSTTIADNQNVNVTGVETRQWLNVIYSKRSNGLDIYIDNELRQSMDFAAGETSVSNNGSFYVGFIPGSPVSFTGLIDDIQIFNRLLSGTERASVLPAPPAGQIRFTLAGAEINEDSGSISISAERIRGSRAAVSADIVFDPAASTVTLGSESNMDSADIAFSGSGTVISDRTTVNWPAGSKGTQSFSLLLDSSDDDEREGTEIAVLTLDTSATAGLGKAVPDNYRLRLADVTPNPYGNFELVMPADPLIAENDNVSRSVCIVRSSGGEGEVVVSYEISGTAQPGSDASSGDFHFLNSGDIVPLTDNGTVVFAGNPTTPYSNEQKCFAVQVFDRPAVGTPDRSLVITLTGISGEPGNDPLLSTANSGTLIIRDWAPGQFEFTADAFSCKEPNTSTDVPAELRPQAAELTCEITVRRYNTAIYAPAAALSVSMAAASVADAADASFTTSLSFPELTLSAPAALETEVRKINVAVSNDNAQENDEILVLQINPVTGEEITRAQTQVTLIDVTSPSLVTISSPSSSVDEGSAVTFNINRSNNSATGFTVDYRVEVAGKATGKTDADYIDFSGGSAATGSLTFADGGTDNQQLVFNTVNTLEPTASLDLQVILENPDIPRVVGLGVLNNANKDNAINRTDETVTILNTKDRIEDHYTIALNDAGSITTYQAGIADPASPAFLTVNKIHSPTRKTVDLAFTLAAKDTLDIDHDQINYQWRLVDNSWSDGIATQTNGNALFAQGAGALEYGVGGQDPSLPLTAHAVFTVPFVVTARNFTLELTLEGSDGVTVSETFVRQIGFTASPVWRELRLDDSECLSGPSLGNCGGNEDLWTWNPDNQRLINKNAFETSATAEYCFELVDDGYEVVNGFNDDEPYIRTCNLSNGEQKATFTTTTSSGNGYDEFRINDVAVCGYFAGSGLNTVSNPNNCSPGDRRWNWRDQ